LGAYSDSPDPPTIFKGPGRGEGSRSEAYVVWCKRPGVREWENRVWEGCLPSNWGLWTRQWRRKGREKGKEGSLSRCVQALLFSTFKHWKTVAGLLYSVHD